MHCSCLQANPFASCYTYLHQSLQPEDLPSEWGKRKICVIVQHIAIAMVVVSLISAIFTAIILSPPYFLLSLSILSLSLLTSYRLKTYLQISPANLSQEKLKTFTQDWKEKAHHDFPSANPDILNRMNKHLKLKYLPNTLPKEEQEDLKNDFKADTSTMSEEEATHMEEDMKKEKEKNKEWEEFFKEHYPEAEAEAEREEKERAAPESSDKPTDPPPQAPKKGDHKPEPTIPTPVKEHLNHHYPSVNPDILNRVHDHMRDKYFPNKFTAKQKADLKKDFEVDTIPMSAQEAADLFDQLEKEKAASKKQDDFFDYLDTMG